MAKPAWMICLLILLLGATRAEEGDTIDGEEEIEPVKAAALDDSDSQNRDARSYFWSSKKKTQADPATLSYSAGYGGPKSSGIKTGSSVWTSSHSYSSGGGGGSSSSFSSSDGLLTGLGSGRSAQYHDGLLGPSVYSNFRKGVSSFAYGQRKMIPAYGACPTYRLPANVNSKCLKDKCEVSCLTNYAFPNGLTKLNMVCVGGSWILLGSEYDVVPDCAAVCLPQCQNNGICDEPGKCKCADNFTGPLCQYKKSICASKPMMPANSRVSCSNNVCTAECMRGFQFPDGSSITNLECTDGQWVHTKSGALKAPDCRPICEPPCSNGGTCISFNVCNCGPSYRGSHCQFSTASCNITKTSFNGNYKCSYGMEEAKCLLTCPEVPGLKVDGDLNIEYSCKYSAPEFLPKPFPKCNYPPGYTTRAGSTSHFWKESSMVMGGGGGDGSSGSWPQTMSHKDRIMIIIAKYRDFDRRTELWSSEETSGGGGYSLGSYTLYETMDMNVVIDKKPRPALCATWGGINVKTFDGLVFKTPLSCSHTLITDNVDATFEVALKGCPYGSGYGCAHTLKVYWQSITYTFTSINGTVQLANPLKNLSISSKIMGMKISPVAQHIQIELELAGLKIVWDQRQYVAVYSAPLLWGKVGGLCGSLDGDYSNDLMGKRGMVEKTVKTFADSWRVDDKSDTCVMENSAELEFGSETCDSAVRQKAVGICERLLTNEKLSECIKPFNFEALLRTCFDDYCNCPNREHPETCNCDAVSMLAKECTFKGAKLKHGWRNLEICPISCSNGRVYLPCGPDAEPTCDSAVAPTSGKCNEGCFCPEGTVQYKDACITPELCPCTLRGKEYKPEQKVKKHCNTCTCNKGQWKCTDEKCGARCGAIGDPHYQTFDGKRFDFMGKCSYYLLKTANLSVEAENIACSGTISVNMNFDVLSNNPSCTKSVTLRFAIKNGVPTTIKLDQRQQVHVNQKEITKFPKVLGAGEVLIRQASSTFVTVEFPNGIRVWWDGISRVYIDAPPTLRDQTSGLCGTFNSNTQDDFLTPEGDIETAVEPFADKWRTKETCDQLAATVAGPHPCSVNPQKRSVAEKHCNWIMDDIFQACHWVVEPEQYVEDCMYDVCACKDEPAECFCQIISAYGTECARQGVKTGWRLAVKECAIKCPLGQVYDECGDSCTRTCEDLSSKNTCKKECVEGCRCPHGEYLNDANECVPQQKCPCTYDGVSFRPGYKEVRPGEKFLDLCTCSSGLWECEDAEEGDEKKYPPSSELRAECENRPFAKFSKCAPKEPKTCKNMHEYVGDLEECSPECVCMAGYVYDTSRKVCVLPESCSCHHGGKSYSDGEKMKEACNTCVCKSGKWKCSTNGCESTCSVWGDSHFTTFDNHDFDFQGACDYILAKGVAENGDGFTISIQNVLCGTMGVTCSKSVELSLTGSIQDTVLLADETSYKDDPSKAVINLLREKVNAKAHGAFHVYKAGVFIVVEVIPMHLQIKWDEGTRVYVKLGKEWQRKVIGLCGNYNDDAMDDMQTPSLGLETSPLLFGHSWKMQNFCAKPTQPIDSCKEHPERESWAEIKCGILKSDLFKECHLEVPVEKYLKRCTFDTCACDQGGDCECLCTAIAAYAQACSQKGINIRWRTPHLCPMQCDPHCSEYKACTPACSVETCDNFLDQGIAERMCNKENCFEGCYIKPCPEGMIYVNDTFKDCVPKAECKPVCMKRDGKTYYENDITYTDDCSTCRCSKKKEVCSGVKCADVETLTQRTVEGVTDKSMATEEQPKCVRGWSRWVDKDSDTSGKEVRLNDEEKLPRYDRLESVYGTCQKKFMKKIECRVVGSHESSDFMNENVRCNLQDGLACVGQCHDYELHVFCQCDDEEKTTPPPLEPETGNKCDLLIAEYKEYPGDCHKFLHCQPQTDNMWRYVEKTCGEFMMFNPTMNVCDHIATVQEIKPTCGVKSERLEECPDDKVMVECANQCEHTCHYYGMILKKRGLCLKGEHCKPGCVPKTRTDCPKMGKLWRDESTCVEADECPCMDKNEKYVQPHMPVIGEWEVCQCMDNAYTCLTNKPEVPEPPEYVQVTKLPTKPDVVLSVATVTPPIRCGPERLIRLIEGSSSVPSVFSASSQLSETHAPANGRLWENPSEQLNSWSPSINDQMQFLQITFESGEPLFGVVMAGNPQFDNYVTLFKILYSHDGESYHYLVDESEKPQLFNGPLDSRTPIEALFKIPIEAKSVRIYPLKWHSSIAMRVDLLGCGNPPTDMSEMEFVTLPTIRTSSKKPAISENVIVDKSQCVDKMGVESGDMHPKQVKASSIWQTPKAAKKPVLMNLLKLSSHVGWKSVMDTPNEYIEFDFLEPRNISGFTTKGGPDGWVTGFIVQFSKNKLIWNKVLAPDGQAKLFPGNHDSDTEQETFFYKPILTQYLKFVPAKWEKHINMRIEPIGCYKPYPELSEDIKELEVGKPKCLACEGILVAGDQSECKCKDDLFWDGNTCVPRNLCPCVENYVTYPIGSKFENKACEECVCVLGGHMNCKSKKCPPCEGDLRAVISSGCFCKCEPCPKYQKLCPSSGDCIPEQLWCNGVRDCADDEDASCRDKFEKVTEKKVVKNETIVIQCPMPECPPQMKIKIIEKKARKMSKMFSSTKTKHFSMVDDGNSIRKTKMFISTEEFLPMPSEQVDMAKEEICAEFTCIPIVNRVVKKNETVSCSQPKCPDNYEIELDMSNAKPGDCHKYTCVLRPKKDDVCEISGKTLTTFDGTEFKYDTCSHILARDIANSSWVISLHLKCTDDTRTVCRKAVTIKDMESVATLVIMPDMKMNFNGFDYTVQQLINSPICKAAFVISQPGNTVLVVSRKHGYWVSYDDIGYIRVGISSQFIGTVDGLCGYYNGVSSDDKRMPDGTVVGSTVKFGDSWFDKKVPKEECYAQTCPLDLQRKALALCNTIKHPTFLKCIKSVNYKQFVSKCMETTCECLKVNNGNAQMCKCNILQDFVKKCLIINPNVQLSTWRAVHQCDIACPAPLVHMDCYKRRCEPSCDSLTAETCSIIPDACYSGCYCPEGTVRNAEDKCVPVVECKDCVCNSYASTKFITYDKKSFTVNGNCTYLLSRDIVLPGVHTFQVYVSMDDCKKLGQLNALEHTSCAKSLHILNGDHLIHIQRITGKSRELKVFIDGFSVKKTPYKDTWIELRNQNSKELVLNFPESHVELKAAFEDLVFTLSVPSIKYGSKMEGLCGDCNGSPDNDLLENPAKKKGRKPRSDLSDVVRSWQANEPKLGLPADECASDEKIAEECVPLSPENDPCMMMYEEETFGKCNMIVDPMRYVVSCQEDLCKVGADQKGACDSLSAYARECIKQGICVNWRRPDFCPYDCGTDKIYKPCSCMCNCETVKAASLFDAVNVKTNTVVNRVTTEEMCSVKDSYEGCFCPSGKVFDEVSNRCVIEAECLKCDDNEHFPGDKWKKDKCTDCECDVDGKVTCAAQKCLVEESICQEGSKPQKIITEEHCCPRYICVPELRTPPPAKCPPPVLPVCGPGQFKKEKVGSDGCPQYICECKPKEDCDPLEPPRPLKPGEKLIVEEMGCCPTQKIVCDKTQCPKKPPNCVAEFYEVHTSQDPSDCCPSYKCEPPKDLCIVQYEGSAKFTKPVNEKWLKPQEPCRSEQCVYGPDGSTRITTVVKTCEAKCPPGFAYVNKEPTKKCCGECVQTECVFETKLFKPEARWQSADKCTSYYCAQKGDMLIISSLSETCPDVSKCPKHLLVKDVDGCCERCKEEPIMESQKNCLPLSLALPETLKIVKTTAPGHGVCVNAQAIQGFTECTGSCNSGSKYNVATFKHDKICNCCNIKSYKSLQVPLVCDDGFKMTKEIEIPAACSCMPCIDSVEYQTDNFIDIKGLPMPMAEFISQRK